MARTVTGSMLFLMAASQLLIIRDSGLKYLITGQATGRSFPEGT